MPSRSLQTLNVVSKTLYDRQHILQLPSPSTPLTTPSSVRLKSHLITLSSNNLSYCAAGDFLHWWKTYPVPLNAPEPYNDTSKYGVPPAWGYGVIESSTIDALKPGDMVYGFMPVSAHLVDLQLTPSSDELSNLWVETSPHRKDLMSLYQRYFTYPQGKLDLNFTTGLESTTDSLRALSVECMKNLYMPVLKIWGAGYLLANYIFPPSSSTKPIHPFGFEISPWTEDMADLTSSLVVCVAAGTKTNRCFLQQLGTRRTNERVPEAVIEITAGDGCAAYLEDLPFKYKTVGYANASTPDSFKIDGVTQIEKIVILDFGGRDGAAVDVASMLSGVYPDAAMVCVKIGGEAKVYSPEERKERQGKVSSLKAVQMNASPVVDEVMKRIGEREYNDREQRAFEQMVETQLKRGDTVLGVKLRFGNGIRGDNGVERFWNRLCAGEVSGDEGVLVRTD